MNTEGREGFKSAEEIMAEALAAEQALAGQAAEKAMKPGKGADIEPSAEDPLARFRSEEPIRAETEAPSTSSPEPGGVVSAEDLVRQAEEAGRRDESSLGEAVEEGSHGANGEGAAEAPEEIEEGAAPQAEINAARTRGGVPPAEQDKDAARRERNLQRLADVSDPRERIVAAQALLNEMLREGDLPRAERVLQGLPEDTDRDQFRADAVRTLSWKREMSDEAKEAVVKFAEGIEDPARKKEAMRQMLLARLGKEEIDLPQYARERAEPGIAAVKERAGAARKGAESFAEHNRFWLDPREGAKWLLAAGLAIPTALGAGAGSLRERADGQRNKLSSRSKGIAGRIGVFGLGALVFALWLVEKSLKSFYKRFRKYVPEFLRPLGDKLVAVGEKPGGRR
ncbi:MAG: hypothetical protein A2682_00790 [Candidatus Terrybacteria bacterium RIFCSPHIGHO2_01_FULL_58_15]|uniref:Uncharacterized protein n=1 Tax=Terrybacteria sp. (strain RIFCSPHIGHO2_01_FULL_58_15) TaxID=1802363 RepID=A0A1G2PNJ0_TERXR|nr:MAG: hypothetical protein A2682_00790 [Candidatus Terrybacteria bacterium RIFCSPHIGHO2_01_FULL_58_15]